MIRLLDIFSGIGAFALGLQRAGATPVAFCENDPFCRDILNRHWPMVPVIKDAKNAAFPEADVICGGFPCQDVSRAGKRAGLAGGNSGLFWELVRALRMVRPKVAIVENVAALLDDGMGTVLSEMAESGFDAEWDCVPAIALGACHERDRIWIVAHPASERCGQGRPGRPPDSFSRIRNEARRNATDPCGARYAFRAGLGRDAWEELTAAQRSCGEDVEQSIWPDEPALSGMDDAAPDWVERTKATGNTLDPLIPELIGRAIFEQLRFE